MRMSLVICSDRVVQMDSHGTQSSPHWTFLRQSRWVTSHISTHYLLRLQPSKTDYYSTTTLHTRYNPYSRVPQPFSSSLLSYSPPDLWVQQSPQLQSKRIYNKECTRFVLHSPCAGSERATEWARRNLRSMLLNQPPIRCSQPLLSSLGMPVKYRPLWFTQFQTHR